MRIQIVLNLNDRSNAELLTDADHYTSSMTGPPRFAGATVVAQVTLAKTATTNFRTALNAPTSDTKMDDIKTTRDALERNLVKLAGIVEDMANDAALIDVARENIVHSAGMNVKSYTRPQMRVFKAMNTEFSGTVRLVAKGGAKAHEWQYTDDVVNFANRVTASATTKASVDISNLARKTDYAFFHKPIISGETTAWEGPIFLTVI